MIRLIGFDLDGTLLTDDKRVTPRTRAVLASCAARGIALVPVTGRPFSAIPGEVLALPGVRYAAAASGADIRDLLTGEILNRDVIPTATALTILRALEEAGFLDMAFIDGVGYAESANLEKAIAWAPDEGTRQYLKHNRTPVADLREYVADQACGIEKFTVTFPRDCRGEQIGVERALEVLKPYADLIHVVCGRNISLEAGSATADKGRALTILGERLGIPQADIMAIGDSGNDIDMRRSAGIFAAMGNAEAALKAAADFVTLTNEEDGAAAAILRAVPELNLSPKAQNETNL